MFVVSPKADPRTLSPKSDISEPLIAPVMELPGPSVTKSKARKSIKRASSVSNDQLYERDRFRSRFSPAFDLEVVPSAVDDDTVSFEEEGTPSYLCKKEEEEAENPFAIDSSEFRSHTSLFSETASYGDADIKLLTVPRFEQALDWYFSHELPSVQTMFPWLHGLHHANLTQIRFFTSTQLPPVAPRVRMLMTLRSAKVPGLLDDSAQLKNSVDLEEIMKKLNICREDLRCLVNDLVDDLYAKKHHDTSDLKERLYKDCVKLKCKPLFRVMDPPAGITLRNYHIQSNKVSQVADIVVYCFNDDHADRSGENCRCESLARVVNMAQMKYHKDFGEGDEKFYNTYLLQHTKGLREATKISPRRTFYGNITIPGENESSAIPASLAQAESAPVKPDHSAPTTPLFPDMSPKAESSVIEVSTGSVLAPSRLHIDQLKYFALRPLSADSANTDPECISSPSDLASFQSWDVNYLLKERLEIAKMSSATRLFDHVWVGNTLDWHNTQCDTFEPLHRDHMDIDEDVAIPRYCDPSFSLMGLNPQNLAAQLKDPTVHPHYVLSTPPREKWRIFVKCHENGGVPHADYVSALMEKLERIVKSPEVAYEPFVLNFACSGAFRLGSCTQEIVSSIMNLCKVLFFALTHGIPLLLYSSDGYTENSFLTICLTMYGQGLGYGETLMRLHNEYGRPFFIFPSDQEFLIKVEPLFRKYSPVFRKVDGFTFEPVEMEELVGQSVVALSDNDGYDWLRDCDGTLPSRILPHLYLGSLKHALNLTLLREMGITKIISIGEKLPWMEEEDDVVVTSTTLDTVNILNIANDHSISKVMKIDDLQDDGIDTLAPVMSQALGFIDREAFKIKEKVLVHCRVGVSRSASVVIAEVMTRMGIDLPRAYMYVRVRRLNVIIQPNLRFFYEMFKWEETQARKKPLKKNPSMSSLASQASTISLRCGVDAMSPIPLFVVSPPPLMVHVMEGNSKKHQRLDTLSSLPSSAAASNVSLSKMALVEKEVEWLRQVDWFVLCREITSLNKAYINT
ncbi:hypothetical protein BABINDRAFT_160142 [Babjeviella inositovora NRRL Y-12698]|uniref:Uncharacterized protein n=1 Tax=Babjeviella inositovora NRRL Y-12698 TaxID=984486 RepID=A0A1E3QW69_9ASCO|nr:uncharacterized protein BABINDRAFT_160142 [Babjeviella inositovora NRRL Y-12698]ODQ81915.1 hypothetical protein BABINDRAFT_160142 [Babjeviella inositovora NRRL Y-12698]